MYIHILHVLFKSAHYFCHVNTPEKIKNKIYIARESHQVFPSCQALQKKQFIFPSLYMKICINIFLFFSMWLHRNCFSHVRTSNKWTRTDFKTPLQNGLKTWDLYIKQIFNAHINTPSSLMISFLDLDNDVNW